MVSQKILDLSALRKYQASRTGAEAPREENYSVRDEAAAEVARLYLAGVRAQAVVSTESSNLELSETLLKLAKAQKQAGTGTGIEVTRAEVQLANDRQALLVAQAELTRARLQLLKGVGIDMTTPVQLVDELTYNEAVTRSFDEAMRLAHEALPSLKAQKKREESAALTYSAVGLERVPSLSAYADYGAAGLKATDSQATHTFGIALKIPIFDGGSREARTVESRSLLSQEKIRSNDLERQVELRIRVALDAVESADAQVEAAEDGLVLSNNELEQAQRRYTAGVASGVEVTDAQTQLQRARENRVSALYNHALARVDLASATGTIQQLVNNWR